MALAHSFYAEQRRRPRRPRRGPPPPAGRARLLRRGARRPVRRRGPRRTRWRSWRILDGDLDAAERHYRAAAEGFARLDRPVMNSMCLGMVADFDERAGDYPAAITTLEAAIATNEALGSAASPGRSSPASAGCCSTTGELARAEAIYERALDVGPPRAPHAGDLPRPGRHGRPAPAPRPRRRRGRRRPPRRWSSTGPASPRRFRNRIDPSTDLPAAAAVCCAVLAAIAAETATSRSRPRRLLGQADRLRARRRAPVPAFQHDDVAPGSSRRRGALGEDAFAPRTNAVDARRSGPDGWPLGLPELRDGSAPARPRSAPSWMVLVVPQLAGPDSRRIP